MKSLETRVSFFQHCQSRTSSDLIVVKREVNGTTLLLETRVSAFENIRRLAKILPILRSLNNFEMLFDIYLLSHSIDGLDPRDFVHLSERSKFRRKN